MFNSLFDFRHESNKLRIFNLSISVEVSFLDHGVPVAFRDVLIRLVGSEYFFQFVLIDFSTAIYIKHFESHKEFVLLEVYALVHRGCNELCVIDSSASVSVHLLENFLNFLLVMFCEFVSETLLYFRQGEHAVAVFI